MYLSLTQTIKASSQQQQQQQQQQVLPVCLGPDEVSRALEAGINAAFQGQFSQNAAVDTTYVQVCVCVCDVTVSTLFVFISGVCSRWQGVPGRTRWVKMRLKKV
jgi:hypothetical protein